VIAVVLAIAGSAADHVASSCANPDVIARYTSFVTYCESCGDRAPSAPRDTASDRGTVDPWHTYAQTSPWRYDSVAALSGCASADPPSLRVETSTDNGVLIAPDREPAREDHDLDLPDELIPGWVGPVGGALGGAAVGGLLGILVGIRRRAHRVHLPRALDLTERRDR
jgi:hypothetical protein